MTPSRSFPSTSSFVNRSCHKLAAPSTRPRTHLRQYRLHRSPSHSPRHTSVLASHNFRRLDSALRQACTPPRPNTPRTSPIRRSRSKCGSAFRNRHRIGLGWLLQHKRPALRSRTIHPIRMSRYKVASAHHSCRRFQSALPRPDTELRHRTPSRGTTRYRRSNQQRTAARRHRTPKRHRSAHQGPRRHNPRPSRYRRCCKPHPTPSRKPLRSRVRRRSLSSRIRRLPLSGHRQKTL